TQPVYLTSSLQQTPESLPLLQLFNYLEGDREQYLYMRLFCSALPQELARLYRPAEPPAEVYAALAGREGDGEAVCLLVCPIRRSSSRRFASRLDANVRALRQTAGQFVRALTQCRLPYSVRVSGQMHSRIPVITRFISPMLASAGVARRYRRRQPAAADAGATAHPRQHSPPGSGWIFRPSLTDRGPDPLAEILDELERVSPTAPVRCCRPAFVVVVVSQSGRVTLHLSPRHDPLDLDYLSRADRPGHAWPLRTKRLLVDILLSWPCRPALDELIRSTSRRRPRASARVAVEIAGAPRTAGADWHGWRSRRAACRSNAKKSRVLEALDRLAGGDAAWSVDRAAPGSWPMTSGSGTGQSGAGGGRSWPGCTPPGSGWPGNGAFQEEQADYYARATVRPAYAVSTPPGSQRRKLQPARASRVGSGGSQQQQQKQVKYTAAEAAQAGHCARNRRLSPGAASGCSHEGAATIHVFNRAGVNVNLLLHLINKKFYTKAQQLYCFLTAVAALIGLCSADTPRPANCSYADALGTWQIWESERYGGNSSISCNGQAHYKYSLNVTLQYPDQAVDSFGNVRLLDSGLQS
uniref:CathepsinC_exc domain-containing protein n=1 Tax=Macrostomum lignano TaxID=282301 RepID=A0A1I8FL13_9PLAT